MDNPNGLYVTDDYILTHNILARLAIPFEGLMGEYGIYFNKHLFPWYNYGLLST